MVEGDFRRARLARAADAFAVLGMLAAAYARGFEDGWNGYVRGLL